ncbi:TonB-dependent receptor [Lichenicoccus sp.]|uniref:TonB-dependent receptor n=1 Tax=Lichenicoccus sp. TaxID=2781899 RepID=UPI003D0B7DAE
MSRWSSLLSALMLGSLFVAGVPASAAAQSGQPHTPPASRSRSTDTIDPASGMEQVTVRLDRARSALEPDLGATVYRLSRASLQTLPQGDNTPLNQVLLQAPGVAQDSYGQIHIRGDHNEVQFRLDGVQLPEGLSVFGQALQTRFAHSLSLITGALPAQYGFDTAAVIDITTKSGITDPGGEISLYGGQRDDFQPSFSYGGHVGNVDYFVTGDALHDRVGIENPAGTLDPIHDLSNQTHGIAHIAWTVDADTRVSLLAGASNEFFEIPNNPGQTPSLGLTDGTVSHVNSSDLTEHQREITDFAILSLQKEIGALDLQSSVFTRYSSLSYTPDPLGDLLFDGVSQTASKSVLSTGIQTDASWRVSDQHTIRAGLQITGERLVSNTVSTVLPAGGSGGDTPFQIFDGQGKTGGLYGVYVQDEWHILPHVTLNYGTRFDVVDEYTHENQLSPRVNVVWQPWQTTTIHAGYSRYFIPPPFELVGGKDIALFNGTSAAAAVTQDSIVKAERDNYYDAGITQIIVPGLQVGLDAYYKEAQNLIDEGQFGAPIILSAFNYAHGDVHGYEASVTYDRGPLSLYANVALSRAVGRDIVSSQFSFSADELAYISQHFIYLDHNQTWTGSGGAAYTAFSRTDHPARLSADLIVGSGLRADGTIPNGQALPGYATINLAAVQTFNSAPLRATQFRLDVINLLDRVYEIRNGTGVGVGAPQFGLRRTLLVGIAERF